MGRKKKQLPAAGTAFAFPIGDGRYAVCRVLLDRSSRNSKSGTGDTILAACSAWIGDHVPHSDDPALRPILRLTHHAWKNVPAVLWVLDEPPQQLIHIGIVHPSKEEQEILCGSFGSWTHLLLQPLAQWRWDHERDAVLAEDVIRRRRDAEIREKVQREREQYLRQVTLEQLRDHSFFPTWHDYPPPKAVRVSRKIMVDTVERLLAVGPLASEGERMAILQQCIESFNELDARTHFIETVEREDICEEFEAIVHACGMGGHEDLADTWRDW